MQVDGYQRSFVLYRPTSAKRNAPLVIVLHGSHNNGPEFEGQLGFDQLAAAKGIVTVYPTALPPNYGWHMQCCSAVAKTPVDIDFLRRLIHYLRAAHVVGRKRAVVTGFSSGGIMSFDAACKLSPEVGAIVAVSGTMFDVPKFVRSDLPASQQCAPAKRVTVITVNGSADSAVPLAGVSACGPAGSGDSSGRPGVSGRDPGSSVPACGPGDAGYEPAVGLAAAWWARLNKCTGATMAPPAKTYGVLVVAKEPGCPSGGSVTEVTVEGAGHDLGQIQAAYGLTQTIAQLATGS